MDFYQLIEWGKKECLKDAPTPCTHACPLGIDVRSFIQKLQKGLVAAAYKEFSLNAVLPGVVCHICPQPCRDHCVRKDVDQAVALKDLEQFCWKQMHQKEGRSYFIREKEERILVCGGGACSLVSAVKLARRGYPVHVMIKGEKPGDALWNIDPGLLPRDVLEEDLGRILSEKYLTLQPHVETIPSEVYLSYDAVLLETSIYGAEDGIPDDPRIFRYGSCGDPLTDIRQGSILSQQMEEYVKVHKVFMTKDMKQRDPYVPDTETIVPHPKALPDRVEDMSKDDVVAEAGRCIQCQCNRCVEVCPMMQHYHFDYPQAASAVLDTVEAQEIDRKRGLYPLMSCMQCGACHQACPVEIDTGRLCILSRQLTHKKKILPTSHYHFWLEDMKHANERAEIRIPAEGTCRYVYFPGCQMGASHGKYVERSFQWLRQVYGDSTALWCRCCCAPAYWSGNEALYEKESEIIRRIWEQWGKPMFILSCPTCMEQFREHFPEIQVVSLWSVLAKELPQRDARGEQIAIFDSCAARNEKSLQEDVRRIVMLTGYEPAELDKSREEAQCCGFGGLVYSSNPAVVEETVAKNSGQSDLPFVTYCTNCLDSFRIHGKASRFLLDLVFETECGTEIPDLTQRRRNRETLKKKLLNQYSGEERVESEMPYEKICLKIDDDMRGQLNKQLLLEDDIRQVIGSAEEKQKYLYDGDTNERIAHKVTGYITVWVRYKQIDAQTYQVVSVYFHRMSLKGEQNDRA